MSSNENDQEKKRCGYVAIVGRPNVGKSTLLNYIVEQKLSITADKPQTTRHQILGVKTTDSSQVVYVDTPGIHSGAKKAINRYMNKAATSITKDVDVIVFVVHALKWTDEDQAVLNKLKDTKLPLILAVNRIDWVTDKTRLLPYLQEVQSKHAFTDIIPISALKGTYVKDLECLIEKYLPLNEPYFPDDQLTDRSVRFLTAEIIREKLVRELGEELPYQTTVDIESFKEEGNLVRIHALVLVETKGQKSIVIGNKGERLKSMSTNARHDIEQLLDSKVFLRVWVKVRKGWSDDEQALSSLGYTDLDK
ncbi:MAG: GTPase Era [Gammaproteobacteria bacterium]|nr:GTPase Era [Gammaproteobacteria bacterium]